MNTLFLEKKNFLILKFKMIEVSNINTDLLKIAKRKVRLMRKVNNLYYTYKSIIKKSMSTLNLAVFLLIKTEIITACNTLPLPDLLKKYRSN